MRFDVLRVNICGRYKFGFGPGTRRARFHWFMLMSKNGIPSKAQKGCSRRPGFVAAKSHTNFVGYEIFLAGLERESGNGQRYWYALVRD